MKETIRRDLPFLVLLVVVISFSLSIIHTDPLKILRHFFVDGHYFESSFIYFALVVVSTIFSPITVAPIIPFVGKVFGSLHAFVVTFAGVFTGSFISFWVARKFGREVVLKFFSKTNLMRLEKRIPRNLNFLDILFFRFFTAPDGLSYFLGLYSKLSIWKYCVATLVGLFPIVFILTFGPEGIGSGNKIMFFFLLVAVFIIIFSYLFNKFLLLKKVKLVTHSGKFHMDDIFSAATLVLFFESRGIQYDIIRTRNEKKIEKYKKLMKSQKDKVIMFDIGGEYNEELNLFDHHQKDAPVRTNGIPYSSFGLVWKKYGEKVSSSKDIAEVIDKKICLTVDADDNGVDVSENLFDFRSYDLRSFKDSFLPISKKKKDFDKAFVQLVGIFKDILKREIDLTYKKIADEHKFNKAYYEHSDKRYVYIEDLNVSIPADLATKYPELLFVISKGYEGGFVINTVKIDDAKPFERKKYFPAEWGGKRGKDLEKASGIKGTMFCHKGLSLAIAKTLEGAEKMVKKALEDLS